MATYILPQPLVQQEFTLRPTAAVPVLPAFIAGGHAQLLRYSEASEKAEGLLGTYDHLGANIDGDYKTCYDWPGKAATSVVDPTYTRVHIEDALLRYWQDLTGTMIKTARNKIRHPSKAFKANPDDSVTYPRHADFNDRDVQVGDVVSVKGYDGSSNEYTLSTYVKDIEADQVAASIGAATANTLNAATRSVSAATVAASTNTGNTTVSNTNGVLWNGTSIGRVSEVYTVEVITSSQGGNHATAVLRVTSASGEDDDLEATPSAVGVATPIGSLGLTITFANGLTNDLTVGDKWTVTVGQEWFKTVPTSGGTYTGTVDRTYIVEVSKGGLWDDLPQITVSTTDGTDFSGPHTIVMAAGTTTTGAGLENTAAIAIGTNGVTIRFLGKGLCRGDRFLITATAAADSHFRILVLGHDLDDAIPADSAGTSLLKVNLYIKKTLEIGSQHVRINGNYNWEQTSQELCVFGGVEAYDLTWTDGGTLVALPVINDPIVTGVNKLYVTYRAWVQTLVGSVYDISDVGDLDDQVSGPLHPDNELKWGLYKALQNNNNQPVKYTAVADVADSAAWQSVVDLIEERTDSYGLVPLTRNATAIGLFQGHVQSASSATAGRWRCLWVNLDSNELLEVVSEATEGEVVLATTTDDSSESGTQYTILRGPAGAGVFKDVLAGDTVRYNYSVDAWGTEFYDEYLVEAVVNDDTLRLQTGTDLEQNVPIKVEVWRTLNAATQAEAIGKAAGTYASMRVRAVWPDEVSSDGYTYPGYHLCAALAALRSGIVPHQGMTRLEIAGFESVPRTTKKFTRGQLDTMAVNGTWIVTQDPNSGKIYTRHALTTADYDLLSQREEMIVSNVDAISYYIMTLFDPYIGIANTTDSMISVVRAEVESAREYLRQNGYSSRLGGQVNDITITELRRHATLLDRIVLGLSLDVPYALNNIEVHLVV